MLWLFLTDSNHLFLKLVNKFRQPGNFYATKVSDDHDQFAASCILPKLLIACKKIIMKKKKMELSVCSKPSAPTRSQRLSDASLPGLHHTRTGQTLCQQQCVEQAAEHRATSREFTVHTALEQCVVCVCMCEQHWGTLNAWAVNPGKLLFFSFSTLSSPLIKLFALELAL